MISIQIEILVLCNRLESSRNRLMLRNARFGNIKMNICYKGLIKMLEVDSKLEAM